MKLKDVPQAAAYLVFHDAFDNGAMDIWPMESFKDAQTAACSRQEKLDESGFDEDAGGVWKAYRKLPRAVAGKRLTYERLTA